MEHIIYVPGDFEHHTLSITAGEKSYVDHIAWGTKRPEDVEGFAQLLNGSRDRSKLG